MIHRKHLPSKAGTVCILQSANGPKAIPVWRETHNLAVRLGFSCFPTVAKGARMGFALLSPFLWIVKSSMARRHHNLIFLGKIAKRHAPRLDLPESIPLARLEVWESVHLRKAYPQVPLLWKSPPPPWCIIALSQRSLIQLKDNSWTMISCMPSIPL